MMQEMLEDFITESRDLLEQASSTLLAYEENPEDKDKLNELFRGLHTIKGISGLFEIKPLTDIVHANEELLESARDGSLTITPDITDLILDSLDLINIWIDHLEQTGELPHGAADMAAQVHKQLHHLMHGPPVVLEEEPAAAAAEEAPAEPAAQETPEDEVPDWPQDLKGELAQAEKRFSSTEMRAHQVSTQTQALAAQGEPSKEEHFSALPKDFPPEEMKLILEMIRTQRSILQRSYPHDSLAGVYSSVSKVLKSLCLTVNRPDLALQIPNATLGVDEQTWKGILFAICQQVQTTLDPESIGTAPSQSTIIKPPSKPAPSAPAPPAQAAAPPSSPPPAAPVAPSAPSTPKAPAKAKAAPAPPATKEAKEEEDDVVALKPTSVPSKPPTESVAKAAAVEKVVPAIRKLKTLKVDQERIDVLMDLVGELVVAKNSLPFVAKKAEDEFGQPGLGREIKNHYGVINRIAEELQSAVMQVRMIPASYAFQRFPRLVRDLSRKLKKDINLIMEGEETEADKDMIEDLGEPLIHLVRNSIDHGIESPQDRVAAGKSHVATIKLSARQLDDRVIIEVQDDGAGIDPNKIRQKAIEKGLVTENDSRKLTDQEALQLICLPGFSTKEKVTELSGRGVGMDVVRSMIEQTGGTMIIESKIGVGTTIKLALPLSMTITRVMMVEVGHERFGIPIEQIVETVRISNDSIHRIKNHETVVLRDRLVPLCRLRDVLCLDENPDIQKHGGERVLVVRINGEELGLVVDRFHEGVDIILKPLEGIMAGLDTYLGSALLGDGSVLLVLNLKELLHTV